MKTMNVWVALLTGLALLFTGIIIAGERYGKQKVVYHINYDDPKAQAGALRKFTGYATQLPETAP